MEKWEKTDKEKERSLKLEMCKRHVSRSGLDCLLLPASPSRSSTPYTWDVFKQYH